jgi:hypothetical protein
MELLGDVGQLEARFVLIGDGVNLGVRLVHGLPRMYHGHGNLFGRTRWSSKVTWVKWKFVLVHLKIVLISTQDTWFVLNMQQAQKSFWAHLMELLGDVGQIEGRIGPFGDSANLDAR